MRLVGDRGSQVGFQGSRALWKLHDSHGLMCWTLVTDLGYGGVGNEWQQNPRAVTEWCVVWERVLTKQACVQQPSGRVRKGGEAAGPLSQTRAEPGERRRHHSLLAARSLAKNTREDSENTVRINWLHGIYSQKHCMFH